MLSRFPQLVASLVMTAFVVAGGSALVSLHASATAALPSPVAMAVSEEKPTIISTGEETDPAFLDIQKLPETSSTASLVKPPLAFLVRVKGDPKQLSGETAVRVPTLMYHQIREFTPALTKAERRYTVRPAVFEAQIRALLKAGFTPIKPEQLEAALNGEKNALPKKPILLTFDDGFRSQYDVVFPLLKKYQIPATFFVLSRGTEHVYLSKEMLKEMSESPLVTIASHTERHAFLAHVSAQRRHEEIVTSKKELEQLLKQPVPYFAYPYGDWNTVVMNEVKQAGYRMAFGVRLGSLQTSSTRFQLRRIQVMDGWDVTPVCEAFLRP